MKGLEPPRLTAQDPKSCAATNYATPAWRISLERECKGTLFFRKLLQRSQGSFIIWLLYNVGNLLAIYHNPLFINDHNCT